MEHKVRLIPPAYVKPYVKRQKNDMADAEAICEVVTRPNMHFVAIKSAHQQAVLMLHRARDILAHHKRAAQVARAISVMMIFAAATRPPRGIARAL